MRRLLRKVLCLLLLFALAVSPLPFPSAAEEAFSVSLPKTVKGYTPCEIRIQSPVAGEVVLHLYDAKKNPWRVIRASLVPGENRITWDGLGEHLERLFAGPYHFVAELAGEDGQIRSATARFKISGTTPALVYALPSSETLYLDGSEDWFAECYVSIECTIAMEVRDESGVRAALLSLNLAIINMLPFPALDGGRLLFLVIRLFTGKRVSDETEGKIHFIGICLLFALMIYVTFNDVIKFIIPIF